MHVGPRYRLFTDRVLEAETERDDEAIADSHRPTTRPLRYSSAAEHHVRVGFKTNQIRKDLSAHRSHPTALDRVTVRAEIDIPIFRLLEWEMCAERHDYLQQYWNAELALEADCHAVGGVDDHYAHETQPWRTIVGWLVSYAHSPAKYVAP